MVSSQPEVIKKRSTSDFVTTETVTSTDLNLTSLSSSGTIAATQTDCVTMKPCEVQTCMVDMAPKQQQDNNFMGQNDFLREERGHRRFNTSCTPSSQALPGKSYANQAIEEVASAAFDDVVRQDQLDELRKYRFKAHFAKRSQRQYGHACNQSSPHFSYGCGE